MLFVSVQDTPTNHNHTRKLAIVPPFSRTGGWLVWALAEGVQNVKNTFFITSLHSKNEFHYVLYERCRGNVKNTFHPAKNLILQLQGVLPRLRLPPCFARLNTSCPRVVHNAHKERLACSQSRSQMPKSHYPRFTCPPYSTLPITT